MIYILDKSDTVRVGKKNSIEEYEITDKTREAHRNYSLVRCDQYIW